MQEVGLPQPNLVLYLDLPEETAKLRLGYGNKRYEHPVFQVKVKEQYEKLFGEGWKRIDASATIGEISATVKSEAKKVVELCQRGKTLKFQ